MPFGYSYGGGRPKSAGWYTQGLPIEPAAMTQLNAPATTPAPGTIAGTPPLTYNPAVGGIPSVPDPLKAIQDAITNYTKNLPALQALASQQTGANQAEAVRQITDLYPQFKPNTAQLGADIADWAAGRISQPTVNELTRRIAERGTASGFGPTAPATNAALMSLLGKTSEGLQAQALTGQNTLLAGLPRTEPTSVTSFGLTPGNIFGNLYNAQLQAALYKAAPNPADAYNLAMGNLQGGLAAGGRAGAGPYAGTPTMGGTSSPDILKFLESLISRTSGTPQNQTSQYYNVNPYVPPTPTGVTLQDYGGEFDVVQPGMNYSPDFMNPDGTYKTLPFAPLYPAPNPDEQFWNDFYFNATNPTG